MFLYVFMYIWMDVSTLQSMCVYRQIDKKKGEKQVRKMKTLTFQPKKLKSQPNYRDKRKAKQREGEENLINKVKERDCLGLKFVNTTGEMDRIGHDKDNPFVVQFIHYNTDPCYVRIAK